MTTIRLTPGRTNVTRAEFVGTLRAMHAAKWGRRTGARDQGLGTREDPTLPPSPQPLTPAEDRRLTRDEAAEAARLRQARASHRTWKRLGERYGVAPYAVKPALLGLERT